jgi:hypothetical protein
MNDSSGAGLVVLFGSGETSPAGQKIFDQTLQQLPKNPRVALLETPAGFELNSPISCNIACKITIPKLRSFQLASVVLLLARIVIKLWLRSCKLI